jgi:hypothetical protein
MRLVAIQLALTATQLNALVAIKRGMAKGWGAPDDLPSGVEEELTKLGLVNSWTNEYVTAAGELVILATGNESVVNQ